MDSPVRRKAVRPGNPPDGGYGWFVLLSTFLVFGLTFGVIKAFGVFYVEIHRYFATTATGTSWITSIAVATVHIGAPVGAALSARFSHRAVVMLGGALSSVGMIAGAYAQNLVQLYITVGFLSGLGYALTWTPTVTMLGWYFEKRRPMANGLASAGECVITFLVTPLFQLLVDCYSWRGAMLILGALELNLCVCGALLRPLRLTQEHPEDGGEELEDLPRGGAEPWRRATPGRRVLRYVDYTLVKNSRFMVYSLFGVFAALGFFAPALFLVPYARSRGVQEYQAAALMSISAASDLTGRVACGWLANLRLVETARLLTVTVTALGAVLLLCPLAASFPALAGFSAAYGLAFGATVSIHITVLADVVGAARLGSALGFFMLIRSSGGLLGPPIAGVFIDKMSDYGTGFLMAGVALIVSALFLLLLHQMNRKEERTAKTCRLPRDYEKGGGDWEKEDRE
ncbi:monocarboxylate transporter 13 [Megalops cyprinoides]|uniref:monocarboxylate transporter 13 n=1 Tax=Megalops cyprinoides TaxID=118141 RepID=UPI00186495AB|nr:monocarboxylate transporter 13 [Megalops cyprinoides]